MTKTWTTGMGFLRFFRQRGQRKFRSFIVTSIDVRSMHPVSPLVGARHSLYLHEVHAHTSPESEQELQICNLVQSFVWVRIGR